MRRSAYVAVRMMCGLTLLGIIADVDLNFATIDLNDGGSVTFSLSDVDKVLHSV